MTPIAERQLSIKQKKQEAKFEYIFDNECKEYDWLIVYDDLPSINGERHSMRKESLACPAENTIFIMAEPHKVKKYGYSFLDQFGHIVSCHPQKLSPQEKTIHHIPGLVWYYAHPFYPKTESEKNLTHDEILNLESPTKTKLISSVCSAKKMRKTLHSKRIQFTKNLQKEIPELDVFGLGTNPINDKKDAIDSYKYHLVIENTIHENYISEKLTDAFLGLSFPFYIGAPNVSDYFPKNSFLQLDINDTAGSLKKIKEAIISQTYEKNIEAIKQAKKMVLDDYNIFTIVEKIILKKSETINIQNINNKKNSHVLSRRKFYIEKAINYLSPL